MPRFNMSASLLLLTLLIFSGCSSSSTNEVGNNTELETTLNPFDFEFSVRVSEDGLAEKSVYLAQDVMLPTLMKNEGVFAMAVTPQDLGLSLISALPKYYSKKYTDAEIKETFKLEYLVAQSKDTFFINIMFLGDYSDDSSISMNDDFYEYFFLENEDGDYVRALAQEHQGLLTEINYLNTLGTTSIQFDSDEVESLMQNHETLYLTFDGLNLFQENQLKISYPYSEYYEGVFPEIPVMISEMGL